MITVSRFISKQTSEDKGSGFSLTSFTAAVCKKREQHTASPSGADAPENLPSAEVSRRIGILES